MSRIYDDQKLQNLPTVNKTWPRPWDIASLAGSVNKGEGALIEGTVKNRHRVCITDSRGNKNHFFILAVNVVRAHRRKFDPSGKEVEPNFSRTTKISTGYLNSSYKVEAKGQTDLLTDEELSSMLTLPDLASLTKEMAVPDAHLLWLPEASAQSLDIECGAVFRFKTQGNSPFVSSMARPEGQWSTTANYAGGERLGDLWTDKVMALKGAAGAGDSLSGAEVVGDDEWDD